MLLHALQKHVSSFCSMRSFSLLYWGKNAHRHFTAHRKEEEKNLPTTGCFPSMPQKQHETRQACDHQALSPGNTSLWRKSLLPQDPRRGGRKASQGRTGGGRGIKAEERPGLGWGGGCLSVGKAWTMVCLAYTALLLHSIQTLHTDMTWRQKERNFHDLPFLRLTILLLFLQASPLHGEGGRQGRTGTRHLGG